jgi:hypothetical protein
MGVLFILRLNHSTNIGIVRAIQNAVLSTITEYITVDALIIDICAQN